MSPLKKYYLLGKMGVCNLLLEFQIQACFFFMHVPRGNGAVGQNHVDLISLKYKQPRNVCLCTK